MDDIIRDFRYTGCRPICYRFLTDRFILTDILTTHIIGNINKGNPVIVLGVVGPPEACIITGL